MKKSPDSIKPQQDLLVKKGPLVIGEFGLYFCQIFKPVQSFLCHIPCVPHDKLCSQGSDVNFRSLLLPQLLTCSFQ